MISVIISSTEAEGGLMISAELKRVCGTVQQRCDKNRWHNIYYFHFCTRISVVSLLVLT
jgi:uncharacterized sporulation protein YeaH/YhbH (DUF444 family)